MSASTPSRVSGRPAGTGNYADPYSPIASTPQKQPSKTPGKMAPPSTPSAQALSPMKLPTDRALQRHVHEASEVAPEGSWTNGIFSPVLKYFGNEGEDEASGAGSGAQAQGTVGRHSNGGAATVPARSSSAATSNTIDHLRRQVAAVSVSDAASYSPSNGSRVGAAGNLNLSSPTRTGPPSTQTTPTRATAAVAAQVAAIAQAQAAAQAAAAAAATTEEDGYEYEEFNPYLFIKLLPPYSTVAPRVPRIVLPAKARRAPDVNLVLDLDETLVHCSVDPIPDADVTFPVMFNGAHYQVYVRKRPHLDKFFASIAGKFEVTVFTASQQVYAEKLLNLLDPEGIHIHHRLYRDSCLNVEGNYLKDLNVLGRDMTKTVLVDNSPHAFGYQLDNGIPIESWFEDPKDTELLKLSAFLHTLVGSQDVRPLVRDKFKVNKLVAEAQQGGRM